LSTAGKDYSDLLVEVTPGVLTVTINRPERLNALRIETYDQLAEVIESAGSDPTVAAVVITGAGERAFSAGGDLAMAQTSLTTSQAMRAHFMQRMLRVSTAMTNLGVPVICAVNGACVGGGAELAMFADYIIAADGAYFLFNGTDIGGCSWWGAPQLLPLYIGMRRTEEILYESRRVYADEAERIGLVTMTVPAAELAGEVRARTERLLDLSPEGIRLTKSALRSVKEQMLVSMAAHVEANAATAGPDLQRAFDGVTSGQRINWRATRPGLETTN
jgi:enoyl-CoA hydratase/carnithine racemase